ncbi:MAG: histidine--tRNA ligase [Acidobacteria bacterium]|nr:histidine--tRNA ligase [Acidobacteriota bacterium]
MVSSVKGTFDLFHPEIEKWQIIEENSRRIFHLFGYTEIRTPILEHTELFVRSVGSETDIVSKEMYTFLDKKGRSLTLRPENTAPVMRSIIEHKLYDTSRHNRLYYIGPQFRYERPQKGRYRQFHQIGLELLNDKTPYAEFEGILIAKELLNSLGIGQIKVKLNSVGCPECRPYYVEILRKYLLEKETELCPDCQKRISLNTLRVLDCKVQSCQEILGNAPLISNNLCASCEDHFGKLKEYLDEENVSYEINPRLVRGLDYYVKNVFEITSPLLGAQDAVVGGGRYDGLLKSLGGPDIPSFGWALGVERLSLIANIKEKDKKDVYIAFLGEKEFKYALKLASFLRNNNIPTIVDGEEKSLKNSLKKADKIGVQYVVIIGEDEIKSGLLTLKNLKSGEQFAVERQNLPSFILIGERS